MKKYLGVKLIEAEPMTHGQYSVEKYGESTNSEFSIQNKNSEGYKVVYEDGYVSWSPKEVFEKAYRPITDLTFGLAVEAMKKGLNVARKGWNGKGMFLSAQFPDEHSKMTHPYLYMTIPECEEGTRLLPWQPAQVDLFGEDWGIVEVQS